MAYLSITTLAYFGCFRAGELVSMLSKLGYETPLVEDFKFGYVDGKLFLQLIIKRSKTTTHGFTATIGCSGQSLCAVCSTARYLSRKGITNTWGVKHLLFSLSNGLPIKKGNVCKKEIKTWLSHKGVNPDNYFHHSLRIGCAMLAGQLGFTPL